MQHDNPHDSLQRHILVYMQTGVVRDTLFTVSTVTCPWPCPWPICQRLDVTMLDLEGPSQGGNRSSWDGAGTCSEKDKRVLWDMFILNTWVVTRCLKRWVPTLRKSRAGVHHTAAVGPFLQSLVKANVYKYIRKHNKLCIAPDSVEIPSSTRTSGWFRIFPPDAQKW